ncbi:hypothetical protein CEK65_07480 [Xanthomonas sp. LMG 12459]|nr:hypothetical protein CEK65_07480 [Xanthomonas sp. LMG 12459]
MLIKGLPLRCPCCGYKTLSERAAFEICAIFFWEDDGQDNDDADAVLGSPNGSLSLTKPEPTISNLARLAGRISHMSARP